MGFQTAKHFPASFFFRVGKVSKISKNRSDPTFAKGPTHLGILWGLYVINHETRIPSLNNQVFQWKVSDRFFFSVANCEILGDLWVG